MNWQTESLSAGISNIKLLFLSVSMCLVFPITSLSMDYTSLYTEECYSYADNCNMPDNTFTTYQIRINKAVYGQAAIIYSDDHFNKCYSNVDSIIFKSFKKYTTPLCPLAYSIAEWGANGDMKYSFTPAIPTRQMVKAGVDLRIINPLQINSEYYVALGIMTSDKKYKGPLQIDKSYLVSTAVYKCGMIPLDYYSWPQECLWTFHNKADAIRSSWNKQYEFVNEYQVVAHTAIAHNSGAVHLSMRNYTNNSNWYPWKSSQAVFDYVDFITSSNNINIILNSADSYANSLLHKYKNNAVSGAIYKSIGESRELSKQMGVNWNSYVNPIWSHNMAYEVSLNGDALHNWEKFMYPIQSIWNYRVLQRLYGIQ